MISSHRLSASASGMHARAGGDADTEVGDGRRAEGEANGIKEEEGEEEERREEEVEVASMNLFT